MPVSKRPAAAVMSARKRPAAAVPAERKAKKQATATATGALDMKQIATPLKSVLPSFSVQTSSVPKKSTVGDLMAKISKEKELGYCISLMKANGQILADPASPLPKEKVLTCVIEDLSKLVKEAQQLLKSTPFTSHPEVDANSDLRLGPCRWLGSWRPSWEETVKEVTQEDMGCNSDIEEEFPEGECSYTEGRSYTDCRPKAKRLDKHVYELTLLDGKDNYIRLIAIMRPGFHGTNERITYNLGMTGPIYLRPGLQQVGHISQDEMGSVWSFENWKKTTGVSWYEEPASPLPGCCESDYGGWEHDTQEHTSLAVHLAHALVAAENHRKERKDENTEESCEDNEGSDEYLSE